MSELARFGWFCFGLVTGLAAYYAVMLPAFGYRPKLPRRWRSM